MLSLPSLFARRALGRDLDADPLSRRAAHQIGPPDGIRTRVILVESQGSFPVDDRGLAAGRGIEPVFSGSEPDVLPLNYPASCATAYTSQVYGCAYMVLSVGVEPTCPKATGFKPAALTISPREHGGPGEIRTLISRIKSPLLPRHATGPLTTVSFVPTPSLLSKLFRNSSRSPSFPFGS